MKIGSIIGALLGFYLGFNSAGLGGAIVGVLIGAAGGAFIAIILFGAVPFVLMFLVLAAIIGLFCFIVSSLWNVGKP